ncbi:c-type cytochrome [Billgrantia antri]|uniref:c-type cytochrome n=1 Tax=Billgrantia antri TaxID=2846777 RepID=UPI003B222F74
MKTTFVSFISCGLLLGALSASADKHEDMQQLAEDKQCLSCHARQDDTPRAPGFKSIAAKYSSGEMRGYLVEVVLTGGEDHWGSATMPEASERVEVSEEEAQKLVDWILGMHEGDS